MSWSDLLNAFIPHRRHLDLIASVDSCEPGRYVLVQGEDGSGKSTSLQRLAIGERGLFIRLGPWIDAPEDVAITIIDGLTGVWRDRVDATSSISAARRLIGFEQIPLIAIDNLEQLDGMPQHAEVLARIIVDSPARFVLSGRSGTGTTAGRALAYNRNLARLRQLTIGFENFRPGDDAFNTFVSDLAALMPIDGELMLRDPRALATIFCLSDHGNLGEIVRFFRVMAEVAMQRDDKPDRVDSALLGAVSSILMDRLEPDTQPFAVANPFIHS